jgi:hypothetical protein
MLEKEGLTLVLVDGFELHVSRGAVLKIWSFSFEFD